VTKNHRYEFWLVLLLSLGASAIWSTISLIRKLLQEGGLSQATATLNRPLAEVPWLDLVSQLASIGLALVPVLLALYFLQQDEVNLGLRPKFADLRQVFLVAAGVGIPGIGLYFLALELGLTARVIPTALGDNWWTIPVLLLAAMKAGLLEEVIAVGFFTTKLSKWKPEISFWGLIVLSALFRASYHSYQGFSAFFGNFVMGLVFAYWFYKTKRVAPLVLAHFLMDAVVFIGYPLVFGS
jgi:membrane protease YdiL (CAAX protease family)